MSAKSQINIVKIKVTKYTSVANLVKRTLCVPATSAPVERVFSHSGIVVRPHQSSLAPQRLHKILFLKCSEHVLDASKLLLLVSAIKFLFLFCMINYSQKSLIDHGIHGIQKIVLNIHKKLSEYLLF